MPSRISFLIKRTALLVEILEFHLQAFIVTARICLIEGSNDTLNRHIIFHIRRGRVEKRRRTPGSARR